VGRIRGSAENEKFVDRVSSTQNRHGWVNVDGSVKIS
jgi:hypothetical protein